MSTLLTVVPVAYPPGLTLTSANSGQVITTQWSDQPVFSTNLPVGFVCTILNYSNYGWTSNVLASPMFVLTGMSAAAGATSFTLQAGQSCTVIAASVNGKLCYFVSRGS
jgi:hypothetical protein